MKISWYIEDILRIGTYGNNIMWRNIDQRAHPVGGQPLGQVCPLLNITHQNKSHYINKILKEYFKEKIYYNYFIIK